MDRRSFLGLGGAGLICCIAGQNVYSNRGKIDVEGLAQNLKVPPKVAAADWKGGDPGVTRMAASTGSLGGQTREYWITAEERRWNIVPTHRDQMMWEKVKYGRTTFKANAYRLWSPGFKTPLGPAKVPGPLIDCTVGDTVVIHFRNKLKVPVTMHPHGIFYSNEMDGAYKGKWTDPGGFVQPHRTFTYIWEAHEGTEGAWLYHDHGPMDPLTTFKGLFGPLVVRKPDEPRPDKEFYVAFHDWTVDITGLKGSYYCINGKAYAGNTPTFRAKVGDRVAWHVYAIGNMFHDFHLHGHRWVEPDGTIIDNKTVGPAESWRIELTEDNPGRWFYHCHVWSHLHQGMNGWYIVS